MVLQRRDKRRYILVYVNYKIFSKSLNGVNISPNNLDDIKSQTLTREKKGVSQGEYNDYFICKKILKKRFFELFGSLELEKANITLINKHDFSFTNCFIIRCNLMSLDKVLFVISCCYPPLTTIKISGTLKKLNRPKEICEP